MRFIHGKVVTALFDSRVRTYVVLKPTYMKYEYTVLSKINICSASKRLDHYLAFQISFL